MRDPKRISRICKKLEKVWKRSPDQRLCQIISNLHGPGPQDIFYTEDEIIEDIMDHLIE